MKGLKAWGWLLFATSFVIFWSCVLLVPMNMNRMSGGEALLLMISFVCFVLSITVWAIVRAINETEQARKSYLVKDNKHMKVEIYPLDKVVFDNISIGFGMEKSAVELELGKGQPVGNKYYYFNNEMAIEYIENKVVFVEFLGGVNGKLRPVIYGVSAFDMDASELVEILKSNNGGKISDNEGGYSYQFPNIGIGVYREAIPNEITEMIETAKCFGNPMSNDEIQYEMKRANHWATIGCGSVGYYQR